MSQFHQEFDPSIVRDCIHTLRTSGDLQEMGAAWAWLEYTYGYEAAMDLLADFDAEREAIRQERKLH